MSLALYRKYRPATFAELKGQEHVAEPLQQALRNGRINHAYLFSGPRGCGKTSSARILARSLNCEEGPTPDPCGKCDSCLALGPTGAGHIDVIEIDAASHGGVDDARDLRERAFFAPVAARFKIYIIDEAHMVTREGFNALLKLVEEPPAHLKFIFATTEPEKVIGTIRSRTHHYPFRLIPPGTLRELLEDILQKEGVPYEAAAIPLVVRAGAGSARDSESILDQLLAGSGEEGITYARAVSLLGYTDATLLDEVVDAVAAHDGGAVFAAIDRVMEGGQDPRRFAADLLERFRDLVILSNVPDAGTTGLLDVPSDELERMQAQASRMGPAELTRAADLLHTGLTEMRGATAPRLLLELISARILLPGAYDDESSLLARLDRLERRFAIGEGTQPEPAGPTRRPQATAPPPRQESPPAQGADPTSIVQSPPSRPRDERRSVDNSGMGQEQEQRAQVREASADHGSGDDDWPVPVRPAGASGHQAPSRGGSGQDASGQRGSAPGGSQQNGSSHHEASQQPSAQQGGAQHGGAGQRGSGQHGGAQHGAGQHDAGQHGGQHSGSGQHGAGQAGASSYGGSSQQEQRHDQQPATAEAAAPAAPGTVDAAAIRGMWVDILEAVKQRSKVAWIVLMEGVNVASLDGSVLTLAFANEGKRRGFTTGGKDVVLREALKDILGVDWRIDAILDNGSGPPARTQAPPPDPGGGWGAPKPPEPRREAPARNQPRPAEQPPPPPEPIDEADEVDPEGDADAGNESVLTGMALIEQVLGGKVIQEIDNA